MRGLQPRTFHRAVSRARGGPKTATLTGAPAKRVDWECGQKLTVQPARGTAGSALRRSAPREKLCTRMQRGGALAGSQRGCKMRPTAGRALQCGSKDADERIEVGDDRGGAYMVPSADAPIQSRQKESSEDSERKQ